MSFQDRPSYQRPTKSSSSPSVTPVKRNQGNVPLVRGLSPVRSPYYGRTQELETQRSHDNPLFRCHASDAGERRPGRVGPDSNSTQSVLNAKENDESEEPWKVHIEKGKFGGKPACTTPGKTSRVSTMQFTTPPKPVVKRKILSENNRDVTKPFRSSTPRRGDESRLDVASTRGQEIEKRSSETSSDECDDQQAPMVSIEELQKRIQRLLQTEPQVEAPVSPLQCAESIRRFSGVVCGGSPEPSVEDVVASYHPVFSPYSPRPEFLRARTRSPSPVAMEAEEEENLPYDKSPSPALEKSTTPTNYDPKNKFLSPRPQFLRYRPLRRLELLRRSADGLMDFDLDSPATDADSEKVESETGASESSEVQSIVPEVLTSPTQDAEEIVGECTSHEGRLELEEKQSAECEANTAESLSENSVLTCEISEISVKESSQVDSAGTGNDILDKAKGILDNEEAMDADEVDLLEVEYVRSLTSRVFRTSACLIGVVGFVLLILVSSGSPGILPESLHQNELSSFWRTSEHVAPVREFLKSVEGLWKECPSVLGYPVNEPYMEKLRTSLGEIAQAVTTFDPQDACNCVMEVYSMSTSYVARTYSTVRKWLLDAADSYISRAPDVDEWDWVPEYDFVVVRDVFDWAEAYRSILDAIDSWEIKSIFQSHIDSNGGKSISELIEEDSLENNLQVAKSSISEASSADVDRTISDYILLLPAVVSFESGLHAVESIISETRSPNVDSKMSAVVSLEGVRQVLESVSEARSANEDSEMSDLNYFVVPESPKNLFTRAPHDELASGEAEGPVLLGGLDQDYSDKFFVSASSALGGTVEDTSLPSPFVADCVQDLTVTSNQDGNSGSSGQKRQVTNGRVEEHEEGAVTSLSSIGSGVDMIAPFHKLDRTPTELIQHAPEQLPQEAPSGEVANSDLLADQDASDPQDTSSQISITENTMLVDTEPKLVSSSLLPRLRLAMSPAVVAAAVASVLLAAVIAMIFLRPVRRYSSQVSRTTRDAGRSKRNYLDANTVQVSKGKLPRKPQRTFKTASNPQSVDTGCNYLPGDSPVPTKLSSEFIEHFSTPNQFVEKVYSKPAPDRSSFLSPERSSKQVGDKDLFMTPEIEILEDSSLGRFTALVPVVHNEGTEKEEVKLTPVRRSSRIRSRLQSPCSSTLSHFSYSPEL